MEIKVLFFTLTAIIFFTENIIPRFFNPNRLINIKQNPETASIMGLFITFIITSVSLITFIINKYLLYNNYLRAIAFFLMIILAAQLVKIVIIKYFVKMHIFIRNISNVKLFITYLLINSTVLGLLLAILIIKYGFIATDFDLLITLSHGILTGVGFTIILLLFTGIRERLEFADIPEKLKGIPIAFIVAALLMLAFCGFSGVVL